MKINTIAKLIHWLFTVFIILYITTGLGITNHQIIHTITFGLITKPLAFQLHVFLFYPFIILLFLHIIFSVKKKWIRKIIK